MPGRGRGRRSHARRDRPRHPGGLPLARRRRAPRCLPGSTCIPGVEINATAPDIPGLPDDELHVVGLGVDPSAEAFEALLDRQRGARRRRFELMLARLRAAGLAVDAELAGLDRADDEALGRPTIARALVAAGHATDVPDAFARHIGPGQPGLRPPRGDRSARGAGRDPRRRRPARAGALRGRVADARPPRRADRRRPRRDRGPPPQLRRGHGRDDGRGRRRPPARSPRAGRTSTATTARTPRRSARRGSPTRWPTACWRRWQARMPERPDDGARAARPRHRAAGAPRALDPRPADRARSTRASPSTGPRTRRCPASGSGRSAAR